MMPKLLGKAFFKCKKQPVPVRVSRLAGEVGLTKRSTYLFLGWGPCSAVRIAHTGMDAEEVAANIIAGMEGVVGHVGKGWRGVQSIHIKVGW